MEEGWICLHRKILKWEWYDDINVKVVFIHCLLRANHEERKWRGILVKRGEFISSYGKLAKECFLGLQQLRTALSKLALTREVTCTSNKQHTVFKVNNYDIYQCNNTQVNTRVTHEQHTSNTRVTTNNNENNYNNENKGKEKSTKKENLDFSVLGFTDSHLEEFKNIRETNMKSHRKKNQWTQRVIDSHAKEFHRGISEGYTVDEMFDIWARQVWIAFNFDYFLNAVKSSRKILRPLLNDVNEAMRFINAK